MTAEGTTSTEAEDVKRALALYRAYATMLDGRDGQADLAERLVRAYARFDGRACFDVVLHYFTCARGRGFTPSHEDLAVVLSLNLAVSFPATLFDVLVDGSADPEIVRTAAQEVADYALEAGRNGIRAGRPGG
jgi:hypothetical protein